MEEKKIEKKLSYEELENVCHQLSEQASQLYNRVQQMDMANAFKRLDYLFKIVELSDKFDSDFVKACVAEIQEGMTAVEPTEEKTDK